MTSLLIDQVRNVDPALMRGKGPTARMPTRRKIKLHAVLIAQQQAQGYRSGQPKTGRGQ